MSGHISALKRDSYKRVFRHSKRERNSGAGFRPIFYKQEDFLLSIELYEVNPEYINYLLPYAPCPKCFSTILQKQYRHPLPRETKNHLFLSSFSVEMMRLWLFQ